MNESENIPEKEVSGTSHNSAHDGTSIHSVRDFLSGTGGSKPLNKSTVAVGHIPLHRPDLPCKVISVSNLHHRDRNGKVNTTTSRFIRELSSKDEPYKRTIIISESWEELDTAWVKLENTGYLLIRNDGGRPFQVIPTQEQIQEARSKVIEIGYMLMDYALPELTEQPDPSKKRTRTMWDKPQQESAVITPPIIPLWFIIPGESHQGNPSPKHTIYIRSQRGETSVTIVAIPR